jgi:hypothetical protein
MPPPTTLTGYYTEASTFADNAVTSLQARVTQATTNLKTAQDALAAANERLTADQQSNATLRIALSQAALPSDAAAIVTQLQQNMIQIRIDQAAVGAATDAAGAAARAQQAVVAGLAAARQAQHQAAKALAASQASDDQIAQWTNLVNGQSVTTALTAVNDPSVATLLSAADTALEAIIGTGMLALFRQRRDDFLAAAAASQSAAGTAAGAQSDLLTANEPVRAAVRKAAADYDADVQELQNLATQAVADIGLALGALTNAKNVGSLPPSEQQPLTAATPAALTQVPAEKAVFTYSAQLRTDQAALDTIAFRAYESNPDYDPATDTSAAAVAARAKITADETALTAAQGTLATGQPDIDNWEVLIPDPVMQLVVAVTEAETTIARYKSANVSTLLTDLATKESAYAAALDAQLTYQRSSALIADKLSWRQDAVAAAAQVAQARQSAAIRGAL